MVATTAAEPGTCFLCREESRLPNRSQFCPRRNPASEERSVSAKAKATKERPLPGRRKPVRATRKSLESVLDRMASGELGTISLEPC